MSAWSRRPSQARTGVLRGAVAHEGALREVLERVAPVVRGQSLIWRGGPPLLLVLRGGEAVHPVQDRQPGQVLHTPRRPSCQQCDLNTGGSARPPAARMTLVHH